MSFDPFHSPDDAARRDALLGGGVRISEPAKSSLTPSVPGNQRFGLSELQSLMQHGGFFDATDISTWSNGSHTAYKYPSDFDVFDISLDLSLDPYVRSKQLEDFFLIKIPVKDENTGTIRSELRLFPKKTIQTRYLGSSEIFEGVTNSLPLAYQVMQDITRFPPDNPQMVQNYFSHIREQALSLKGSGHDESVRNTYEYLTKKINYTWLRNNYFKKMHNGVGIIERYGPKTVGKLVHAVRSRFHRINSSTSHHSQSGLASVYDKDGVGRGIAGTMLYMLSFLGVQDVHVVEGIAPDPGLAHLRPASGWTEEELIQLRHAWVRIGSQQYDPTRDIGKSPSTFVWFKKTEKEALDLGHEWYGKIPSFTREKLEIPWRFFLACGVSVATLALALHLSLSYMENHPPYRPDITFSAPPDIPVQVVTPKEIVPEILKPQTRWYGAAEIFHDFPKYCHAALSELHNPDRATDFKKDIYDQPTDGWDYIKGNCFFGVELPIDKKKAGALLANIVVKTFDGKDHCCMHVDSPESVNPHPNGKVMTYSDFIQSGIDPETSCTNKKFGDNAFQPPESKPSISGIFSSRRLSVYVASPTASDVIRKFGTPIEVINNKFTGRDGVKKSIVSANIMPLNDDTAPHIARILDSSLGQNSYLLRMDGQDVFVQDGQIDNEVDKKTLALFDTTDMASWIDKTTGKMQIPVRKNSFYEKQDAIYSSGILGTNGSVLTPENMLIVREKDRAGGLVERIYEKTGISHTLGDPSIFDGVENKHEIAVRLSQNRFITGRDYSAVLQEMKRVALDIKNSSKNQDEIIKKAYDYVKDNVTYSPTVGKYCQDVDDFYAGKIPTKPAYVAPTPADNYGPEVFANKGGVCGGYSEDLLLLLSFAGVPDVHYISGIAPSDAAMAKKPNTGWTDDDKQGFLHAWLKIGDRHYDATFDDIPNGGDQWFGISDGEAQKRGREWRDF